MHIPASVAAELAMLTDALDAPGVDLASAWQSIGDRVLTSVPSCTGLALRWRGGFGSSVVLATGGEVGDEPTRTSLRFPLGPAASLVVRASLPGALVDLAADLAWLTGRPHGDARLDEDLGAAAEESLCRSGETDQAVGVLVGAGLTPVQAVDELDARARAAGTDRHTASLRVLAELDGRGP